MASDKEYVEYVIEQLSCVPALTVKPMFGEYGLYCDGVLFGYVCDNRMLFKKTSSNEKYGMGTDYPYEGAKEMYVPDNLQDKEELAKIVSDTVSYLAKKKK